MSVVLKYFSAAAECLNASRATPWHSALVSKMRLKCPSVMALISAAWSVTGERLLNVALAPRCRTDCHECELEEGPVA